MLGRAAHDSPALLVAITFAPARAITAALSASQAFGRTRKFSLGPFDSAPAGNGENPPNGWSVWSD
jgi:hypothetical protein